MRPQREVSTNNGQTYFVASSTASRQMFFRHERWAELLISTLYSYRPKYFSIHGFVVMPDHFHVLLTPCESLERAVQCIKGGFSFRAKRELEWNGDVWAAGFSDHRIRDEEDFEVHRRYVAKNPVKAGLVAAEGNYAYSSASGRFDLDAPPQGLKPRCVAVHHGGVEAPPLQSTDARSEAEALLLQSTDARSEAEGLPFDGRHAGIEATAPPSLSTNVRGVYQAPSIQSNDMRGRAEALPSQDSVQGHRK